MPVSPPAAARRGLGTGRREDIAAVARQVTLASLEPGPGAAAGQQPVRPGHVVAATAAGRRRAGRDPGSP